MCALICSASYIFLILFRARHRASSRAFHREHLISLYAAIYITTIIISNRRIYISLHNCGGSSTKCPVCDFVFISDQILNIRLSFAPKNGRKDEHVFIFVQIYPLKYIAIFSTLLI